jgi:DNA modification methylase
LIRLLTGDCRAVLRTLDADSVHCCVTSPPYWGLRSYLPPGHEHKHLEIGSEPTVGEWVQTMVEVFREVRRVLRPDGTLWLNLGDSYATGTRGDRTATTTGKHGYWENDAINQRIDGRESGLKAKDLIGQPWRVAFALQADGWWLRQEIIWAKKNPMPESVTDRFTKGHEHVFLLSKSERYYFDLEAVKEPVEGGAHARLPGNKSHKHAAAYEAGDEHSRTKGGLVAYAERQRARYKTPDGWDTRTGQGGHGSFHAEGREKGRVLDQGVGRRQGPPGNPAERKLAEAGSGTKNNDSFKEAMAVMPDTRNPRSVRWLASEPFKGAHFATYPPELIEPFIKAGCPVGGTVLDPFGGSGTTGLVADRLQRSAILIDLDERNGPMAHGRISGDAPLFAEVEVAA